VSFQKPLGKFYIGPTRDARSSRTPWTPFRLS
jgi:hypothetical protein